MAQKLITLKLSNKLSCGVGDSVYLTVTTVSKLTSAYSTSPTSQVPAVIVSVGINDDGTYCYTFSYDSSVLLDICNTLVSCDISTVTCCTAATCCSCGACNPCSCVCSPCTTTVNTCG